MTRQKLVKLATLICACLCPVIPFLMLKQSFLHLGEVSDFCQYYTAAHMLAQGHAAEIYDLSRFTIVQHQLFPDLGQRVVGFYLTPLVIPLFLPLLLVSVKYSFLVWVSILVAFIVASVVALCRHFELKFQHGLLLLAFVLVSGPAYESFRLGQIAPILLLFYVLAIVMARKKAKKLSGVFLFPLLAKPHLLLPLIAIYAGARRFKAIISLAIVTLALGLVSIATIGLSGWNLYFQFLKQKFWLPKSITPTLRDQLYLFGLTSDDLLQVVSFLVLLLVLGSCFMIARKAREKTEQFSILFAMPLALLFSPYVQLYDWILLLPSLICFYGTGLYKSLHPLAQVWVSLSVGLLLMPFFVFIHYYYVLKGGTVNLFFWVGISYLVALVVALKNSNQSNDSSAEGLGTE